MPVKMANTAKVPMMIPAMAPPDSEEPSLLAGGWVCAGAFGTVMVVTRPSTVVIEAVGSVVVDAGEVVVFEVFVDDCIKETLVQGGFNVIHKQKAGVLKGSQKQVRKAKVNPSLSGGEGIVALQMKM